MRTIIITAPEPTPDEAARLADLHRAGAFRIHLRKPSAGEADTRSLLETLLSSIPAASISLHATVAPAWLPQECGLHLPGNAPESTWEYTSRSLHTLGEVANAAPTLRYAFLSPLYPSISKPGYDCEWPPQRLTEAVRSSPTPIFALGGIDETRLPLLAPFHFHGVALLGAIWNRNWRQALLTLERCVNY